MLNSRDVSGAPARNTLLSAAIAVALFGAAASHAAPVTVRGTVAGSLFTPPVNAANPANSSAATTVASVYAGAKVCFDLNNNGACDANEPNTLTSATGSFQLTSATNANVIAEISTASTNNGSPVTQRLVLRTSAAGITPVSPLVPATITVTPLTTEVVRMMENNEALGTTGGATYANAKASLAQRLGVDPSVVLSNPASASGAAQKAILAESAVLTNRFAFAAKMVDRADPSPASLKVNPSNPTPIQIPEAQQVAMNIEGIPRYDHIFIIMLENKATSSILNSPFAPHIDAILAANNEFTNYFATSNPSEPNYTALGGGDDFGITNDDQWNCNATGANAPQDLPLPVGGHSPFAAMCSDSPVVNHNIQGTANLFNSISTGGMGWRTYNESMNPGQDVRSDSNSDPAVTAPDHVYAPGTLAGNITAIGDANLVLPLPAGLYKTKHNPAMAYQNVRSAVEFRASNRTLGGGQWDVNLLNTSIYTVPAGYNLDQFGSDLSSGDIGALNYVIPDQCDDMHSITVSGTDSATQKSGTASDCGGVASGVDGGNDPPPDDKSDNIMARGDNYVQYLVNKIQTSPVWQNQAKREAIVIMFDEGGATFNATAGTTFDKTNSCCGWVPGTSSSNPTNVHPLIESPPGSGNFVPDTSVQNYGAGNHGHGNSIFAVLTNQPNAPKQIKDSDAYSHFSFVRTLQDMFGLSDPEVPASYVNRSKYTESFIAANITNLPEYMGSADTHFDAVRPMSHAYAIASGFSEKQSLDESVINAGTTTNPPGGNAAGTVPPQLGPDGNQTNIWALHP
jgi:hypothetical protein